LEHMEMLQIMSDSFREQQFQTILELGVDLQAILQEIKKLHNAYPSPEGDLATPGKSVANTPDCFLDTPRKPDGPALQNTRIPQNPHKIRNKKKKQILPPCPTQTLEPEKTETTESLFPARGRLGYICSEPNDRKKENKSKVLSETEPTSIESRNAPSPSPQPQLLPRQRNSYTTERR
jgi:hypothetical protein